MELCRKQQFYAPYQRGRAGGVLNDDIGMARNIFGQILGQQPRIKIVSIARLVADDPCDGFVFEGFKERQGFIRCSGRRCCELQCQYTS